MDSKDFYGFMDIMNKAVNAKRWEDSLEEPMASIFRRVKGDIESLNSLKKKYQNRTIHLEDLMEIHAVWKNLSIHIQPICIELVLSKCSPVDYNSTQFHSLNELESTIERFESPNIFDKLLMEYNHSLYIVFEKRR